MKNSYDYQPLVFSAKSVDPRYLMEARDAKEVNKGHKIAIGWSFTLALSKEGRLLLCEKYSNGPSNKEHPFTFKTVPGLEDRRFIDVSVGHDHVMALSEDGTIFMTEYDGCHRREAFSLEKAPVLGDEKFIRVARSGRHAVAINEYGKLFAWGRGDSGQLGQGNKKDTDCFTPVPGFEDEVFVDIAACEYHTLAVTKSGKLYACGDNTYGQLGLPKERVGTHPFNHHNDVRAFTLVPAPEGQKFIQVTTGEKQTLVLSDAGTIFACGSNSDGRLGLKDQKEQYSLKEVTVSSEGEQPKFTQISSNYNHTAALSERGVIYVCGVGSSGQLGQANTQDQFCFKPMIGPHNENFAEVIASWIDTAALKKDGTLFICGNHIPEKGQCLTLTNAGLNIVSIDQEIDRKMEIEKANLTEQDLEKVSTRSKSFQPS